MDWRARKQLTIVAVVFLVIAGILVGLYYAFLHTPSTCTDNKRNQGEEEIDCGGPCVPCAFKHQKEVEVFFTRFVKVRENNYDIVAQIQNPNEHLAGNPVAYRVKLFDDQGAEVGRRENITYIDANDKIYVVESNFVTKRNVTKAEMQILPNATTWSYTNAVRPDIQVGNKRYETAEEGGREIGRVSADVTNQSNFAYRRMNVRVALIDVAGNIAAVAGTYLENVKPGESRKVEFTWPEKPVGEITRVDMEARANSLDRSNLLIQ
ncbi:MAG: hypothetical protein HYT39_03095 [Candidatus Sungbacteria bacterium]|nr:hypothetical protein [Candidatus Sungbacteria bacterium]